MTSKNSTSDTSERLSVARDLHDTIAQELAALGYACDEAISLSSAGQTRTQLLAIRSRLTMLSTTLRDEISLLRSVPYDLAGAVSAFLNELSRQGQTVVTFVNELPDSIYIDATSELEVYRALRELLANIVTHANAEHIHITYLQQPSSHVIEINDDGLENLSFSGAIDLHFGQRGVHERIHTLAGAITYTRTNAGNCYQIALPR